MLRNPKIMICVLLLLGPLLSKARQYSDTAFGTYASQQDKVFAGLYKTREVNAYTELLQVWQDRYRQLPDSVQKQYRRYLANACYNLACAQALVGNKQAALDNLEQSIRAGYYNYAHMMKDADLDIIRQEPAFSKLLQPLRATGDYLYILQKAGDYNNQDKRPLPAFRYQAAADSNLTALRKAFKLDSIAGQGNDVSQVLQVLHWVHEKVPHDGNHENPAVKDALSMLAVCHKENRGLNCRGLATVLNECYLALGFASRLVTCLPKDSLRVDPDCHVINAVYIPSLKKWIWADPTQDAYVMDEKGMLLSIQEVRERLVLGLPLILNPTANWNHQVSATKENYLYNYMAKNLYILQCPVNSSWNMEKAVTGKTMQYIQLLPMEYFKQGPDVKEQKNKQSGTTYQYYNTNNAASFWQLP
jgi:hypothetical protein